MKKIYIYKFKINKINQQIYISINKTRKIYINKQQ